MKKLLIYGANGYTGQLICEVARQRGAQSIIAGRNQEAIAALAGNYGWDYRVFGLEDPLALRKNLEGVEVVLHAAGPFRFTAKSMMEACLDCGVHYIDINGEIDVFAQAYSLSSMALAKNIMLLPGAGFDVVPTDCLANYLKQQMPDASRLELAFVTPGGQISHGTAMSLSERLGEGGACRRDGTLQKEPIGKKGKYILAGDKKFFVMSIPWGDVFTSWHTTGIGNMRAYTGFSPIAFLGLRLQFIFNPILRARWFKKLMQARINKRPIGAPADQRNKVKSYVWGEVTNAGGEKKTSWFATPEAYTLTALTAMDIAEKIMNGDWKPGYQTPAGCYGYSLIEKYISEGGYGV